MKFGKQLMRNSYPAWSHKYLAYWKMKRKVKRYKFQKDQRRQGDEVEELKYAKAEARWAEANSPLLTPASERTPLSQQAAGESAAAAAAVNLNYGGAVLSPAGRTGLVRPTSASGRRKKSLQLDSPNESGVPSPDEGIAEAADRHSNYIRLRRQQSDDEGTVIARDFFGEVDQELHKVDEFFRGKYAELEQTVTEFEERGHMQNSWSVPSGNTLPSLYIIYTEIAALHTYCEMNSEGFRKIVKKFDKTMGTTYLESSFLEKLQGHKFYQSTEPNALLERLQGMVSRDKLLSMKRHAEKHGDPSDKAIFPAVKFGPLVASVLLYVVVWKYQPDLGGNVHASRCLTMLVFVTSLWVTEAIPYFVTSLLIPVLVVMMDIMEDPHGRDMKRTKAGHEVLSYMVNHTTILIMGGYSISSAFSRCEIELRLASVLQRQLGNSPRLFILGIMYLGLFLSTLISNHTAPVLCVSILMPIVRDFDVHSSFAKTLLLGLAFACNFGGMVTPISSMQNVVAQQALERAGMTISFGMWIAVGLPFCVVGVFIAWLLLCLIINPADVKHIPVIVYTKPNVLSRKNVFIVSMTLLTIFGWSSIGYTEDLFGDLGIIALVFIIIAFGSGILSEVDFNSFSWHTLFLLGGGNVLGKAISSSQLLDYLANGIVRLLPKDNRFVLLIYIVSVTMVVSTFVSHTVAALILMPIIVEVGVNCRNPVLLGMGAALAVSSGCALPFSSFPNVTSLLVTDDHGRKYLSVKDFLTSGLPMSIVAVTMICTMGYGLIDAILIPSVEFEADDDASFSTSRG